MLTAMALNGSSRGKTSRKAAASDTRRRVARASQSARRSLAASVELTSAHQAGAAEESLRADQKHDGHQGEDGHLRHFRLEERGHADDHADQEAASTAPRREPIPPTTV